MVHPVRPIFQPELVNGPFGDPALLLDLKFERRALLFDIGDLYRLSTRKLLRVSDVFVSHAHMDHFGGFDRLLRVCLGRDTGVRLFGPPGFVEKVGHKLAAYSWNLVDRYETDFAITACEVDERWTLRGAIFRSRMRFSREDLPETTVHGGVLLEEPQFKVSAAFLDHGIPCLAFSFEEGVHINVWKNRLDELGLPTGPWLTELRIQVRSGAPDDMPIRVYWRDRVGSHERTFELGYLRSQVLEMVPGQRLGYVTDVAPTPENVRRIVEFLGGVDQLFIESVFLDEDADHAYRKQHLTARLAGEIARAAGAKLATPFHFSPRYMGREDEVRREFESAMESAARPVGQ
jgi:ribonuclease Z